MGLTRCGKPSGRGSRARLPAESEAVKAYARAVRYPCGDLLRQRGPRRADEEWPFRPVSDHLLKPRERLLAEPCCSRVPLRLREVHRERPRFPVDVAHIERQEIAQTDGSLLGGSALPQQQPQHAMRQRDRLVVEEFAQTVQSHGFRHAVSLPQRLAGVRGFIAPRGARELRRPYPTKNPNAKGIDMTDERSAAYKRLEQAAAEAFKGAGLLALQTLRDVYREYVALEEEWRDRQDPGAEDVRAALVRIWAKLAPAVTWDDQ